MIIAIDGPAASGKGTLARRLATHYGLNHLDTGLTYRAVAAAMLSQGVDLDDEDAAVAAAGSLDLGALDRETLSRHEVGEAASRVAVMPRVRDELLTQQRRFAFDPPGAVLDGRDIGTVVCPDADVKFFVTAGVDVRARRRFEEMRARGAEVAFETIHQDIQRRDARDSSRSTAPLVKAGDAHLLDTSDLDIETALTRAVEIVDSVLNA